MKIEIASESKSVPALKGEAAYLLLRAEAVLHALSDLRITKGAQSHAVFRFQHIWTLRTNAPLYRRHLSVFPYSMQGLFKAVTCPVHLLFMYQAYLQAS